MAMITALDDQVGRIVAELDKKGMRDNTIIFFASDNGGATSGLFASGSKSNEERDTEEGGIEQGAEGPSFQRAVQRRQGQPSRGRRARAGLRQLAGQAQAAGRQRAAAHGRRHADAAGSGRRQGQPRPSVRRQGHVAARSPRAHPSPNEDILINVEAFRGAIRKGDWKLIKIALLPGKTELFNLASDPGETTNVAEQNPDIVHDLEARLLAYAKQQKPSEWIKAQPAFVGAQGKTVMDPDFDIDDGGLPHEKVQLPK